MWVISLLPRLLPLLRTFETLVTVTSGYTVALSAPYGRFVVLLTLALLACYGGAPECVVIYAVTRCFQSSHVRANTLSPSVSISFRRTLRLVSLGFTAACIHEVDTGMLPLRHKKSIAETEHLSLMDTGLGYFIISDSLSSADQSYLYWKEQMYLLIAGATRICINLYLPTADNEEYGPYWNSFLTLLLVRFLNSLVGHLREAQRLLCVSVLMGLNQLMLSLYPQAPVFRFAGMWAAIFGYFPLYVFTKSMFKIDHECYSKGLPRKLMIPVLICICPLCLSFQLIISAHLMSPCVVLLLLVTTYCCWILTIHSPCSPVPPVRGRWAFLSANILTGMYKIFDPKGIYFVLFEVLYFKVLMLCLSYV